VFWRHVEVRCGRIVMTQSASLEESSPLRPAHYKRALAARSQRVIQRSLFEREDESLDASESIPELPRGAIYAVLMHGKIDGDFSRPGFAVFKFPKGSLTEFHDGDVDLFDEFPDVFMDVAGENVPDTAFPELLDREDTAG